MFWYVVIAVGVMNAAFLVWYKWRGYMTLDRYWLGLMLVMAPFAWALGSYFFLDYVHGFPSPGDELVHGKVFMRQKGRGAWGLQHPELTIKIEGKEDMVKAYLVGDSAEKIPDEVSFYYSGDPKKEVRLREESNPLWAALFLLLTPLLVAVVLAYIEWKRRRQRGPRPSDAGQPT
ncbi:MAG TPA: hypothetical protein VH643_39520 [Gemmataceae bacterium]|jgi:hypothetical protein